METQGPSRRALFRGQLLSKPVAIINDGCLAEAGIVCRSCGDACSDFGHSFPSPHWIAAAGHRQ